MKYLFFFLLILGITACSDSNFSIEEHHLSDVKSSLTPKTFPLSTMEDEALRGELIAMIKDSTFQKERQEKLQDFERRTVEIQLELVTSDNIDAIHEKAQQLISEMGDEPLAKRHTESLSLHFLDSNVLKEATTEHQALRAYYITLLNKAKNPNADIILENINALGNYWTETEKQEARQQAKEVATKWLKTETMCEDCGTLTSGKEKLNLKDTEAKAHNNAVRTAQEVRVSKIMVAVQG